MIQIGDTTYVLTDPPVLAALAGAAVLLLVLILLVMAVRRAGRSVQMSAPLIYQMDQLGRHVQMLASTMLCGLLGTVLLLSFG